MSADAKILMSTNISTHPQNKNKMKKELEVNSKSPIEAQKQPLNKDAVICSSCSAENSIHWDKREISIDDKHGSYLDLTFRYCDQCGNVTAVSLS
jgi:DNA-directed RNA polymerase subunit M/transcription elongation factor TFIIS